MKTLRLARFGPAIRGAPPFTPLDLDVRPGETLALLGPSGAGKSSLLRAIAGLVPSTGRVTIGERDVSALPPERRGAVYLHQIPRLFSHLTVADNIAFPMRLRGVVPAVMRGIITQLLDRIQLTAAAERNVTSLSGGEQQRVALARALAASPDVLLLDEPFAALDPALRAELRESLITLLQPNPPTTVLVTHDPDEAAALASRIAILLHGTVVQVSSPRALFDAPGTSAVATFLGVENLWTRGDFAALGMEGSAPPVQGEQIGVPAAALLATASPNGDHQVVRVRETRNGQRVEGMTRGVTWMATARGGVNVGDTVALTVEAPRVLRYDATGTLMDA